MSAPEARTIRVRGRVQGVGFRPTVWHLARRLGVTGSVRNDGEGVLITASAGAAALDAFLQALHRDAPPLARIDRIEVAPAGVVAGEEFRIEASGTGAVRTEVGPDAATCPACVAEVLDPGHRRSGYALTNCTHCGPRLSIVHRLPWERAGTALRDFPLCPACAAEYADPADRRFHAEPLCCPTCGPRLELRDSGGALLDDADPVGAAADRLAAGELLAVKGIGGFHLVCDAGNAAAVARLRLRKRRPHKPFAVMFRDIAQLEGFCLTTDAARETLTGPAAPVVILPLHGLGPTLPEALAPGLRRLGCMLPHSPLQHLLLRAHAGPLVMTSGNRSGVPQATDNDAALASLGAVADAFLWHDREIVNRLDDSVVRHDHGAPRLLRRARGFAPEPVRLPPGLRAARPLLAAGGDLKAAFCIVVDDRAVLSQHLGDLAGADARDAFDQALGLFEALLDVRPADAATDTHPDSSAAAAVRARVAGRGGRATTVPHHHAHVAACLADHGRSVDAPPVLGIALDGFGLGEDGEAWGGELLLADYASCRRIGRLTPAPLPGGDRAAREPWRNLLARCLQCWPAAELAPAVAGTPLADVLTPARIHALAPVVADGRHAPASSSAGRLFDAVAAALGATPDPQTHEGQAGLRLEDLALRCTAPAAPLPFALRARDGLLELDPAPLWPALVAALRAGCPTPTLARAFHDGLARALAEAAAQLARDHGLDTVALSGGVFQNALLHASLVSALEESGLAPLVHRRVPCNDGGLALGQAVVALRRSQGGACSCA